MNLTLKKYYYVLLTIAGSIISTGCNSHYKPELKPEISSSIDNLNKEADNNKKKVEETKNDIKTKENFKDSLGKNNKYLEDRIKDNEEKTLETIAEIYNDSKYKTTYSAKCKCCGSTASISYDKFYELVEKYDTGSVRHYTEFYEESHKWFLWWEWSHKRIKTGERTDRFEFYKCPECILKNGIDNFLRDIKDNIDKIAQTESELVTAKERLENKETKLATNITHIKNFKNSLFREDYLVNAANNERDGRLQEEAEKLREREEKLKEREEKLLAQKLAAEKEKEIEEMKEREKRGEKEREEMMKKLEEETKKQVNINTAKGLLKASLPIETIMGITGLTKEEIEQLKTTL